VRVARYLLGRGIRGVLTLLTMIAITFTLYFAIEKQPPVAAFFPQAGRGVAVSAQQERIVRHMLLLDRSKPRLFLSYVWHLLRGDFGRDSTIDFHGKVIDIGPVGPHYLAAAGQTLSILIGGAFIVLLLSLPLGAISGARLGAWKDRIISFLALALLCTHPMMLGLILRSAGSRVNSLPTGGYCPLLGHTGQFKPPPGIPLPPGAKLPHIPTCGGPRDWALHLLLPWLTFALLFLALYTRMIRASVAETIGDDFVRTARAKGASPVRVFRRHILPSAGLRVMTMVGMEIGTAIGVCIYIESVFSISGLGSAAVQQLGGLNPTLDLRADLAIVVLITLIVIVGNLVVDLLYAVLDPRVGLQRDSRDSRRSKALVGGVF
jgi:peptide/nickel transport system permease protein